jgi:hypothetical protein
LTADLGRTTSGDPSLSKLKGGRLDICLVSYCGPPARKWRLGEGEPPLKQLTVDARRECELTPTACCVYAESNFRYTQVGAPRPPRQYGSNFRTSTVSSTVFVCCKRGDYASGSVAFAILPTMFPRSNEPPVTASSSSSRRVSMSRSMSDACRGSVVLIAVLLDGPAPYRRGDAYRRSGSHGPQL